MNRIFTQWLCIITFHPITYSATYVSQFLIKPWFSPGTSWINLHCRTSLSILGLPAPTSMAHYPLPTAFKGFSSPKCQILSHSCYKPILMAWEPHGEVNHSTSPTFECLISCVSYLSCCCEQMPPESPARKEEGLGSYIKGTGRYNGGKSLRSLVTLCLQSRRKGGWMLCLGSQFPCSAGQEPRPWNGAVRS